MVGRSNAPHRGGRREHKGECFDRRLSPSVYVLLTPAVHPNPQRVFVLGYFGDRRAQAVRS
jgi:hypothetical protein